MTQPGRYQSHMLSLIQSQSDATADDSGNYIRQYTVRKYEGRPIDGDLRYMCTEVMTAREIDAEIGEPVHGGKEKPFDKDGVLVTVDPFSASPKFITYSLDKHLIKYRMLSLLPEQRDYYTVHKYEGRPIDGNLDFKISIALPAAEIDSNLGQTINGEQEQPFDKDGVLVTVDATGKFITYSLNNPLVVHKPPRWANHMLRLLPEQRDSYTVHKYEGRPIDGNLRYMSSTDMTSDEIFNQFGQTDRGAVELRPFDKDGVLVTTGEGNLVRYGYITYSLDKHLVDHAAQMSVKLTSIDDLIAYIKNLPPLTESQKARIHTAIDEAPHNVTVL